MDRRIVLVAARSSLSSALQLLADRGEVVVLDEARMTELLALEREPMPDLPVYFEPDRDHGAPRSIRETMRRQKRSRRRG
jgi:hypothetical protein